MLDTDKPFIIEVDALKWAMGAVLKQQGVDSEWHPCGYLLKSLTAMEQNYEIYNRELLAIVWALAEWRHYLRGKYKVVVLLDYRNLMYFWMAQKLNRWQARWSLFLSEFELTLMHVPGKQMTQADTLLRCSNEQEDNDNNNNNVILLSECLFIKRINLELGNKIKQQLGPDDFHKMALEMLLTQGVLPIKSALADWEIKDDLLFFKGKVYVPNKKLRRTIV
ncbi:reverse transcriptase-rnase h-integrase [Moniliophthora roreri MCA 2997]|uniref:Reverse transcriptase-rnase h-integrase n=2 Tax=Moniliophthora roreri TaxID=221103 RepID=V2W3B6_MONRO|nr:reverse transcriptase-rnase h-integrase [Moniliophthora roreri MCA 2997]